MDSIAIAKVKQFLVNTLRCPHQELGAIIFNMRQLARMSGYGLDERFARAGLGAGAEARIAAEIVDRALGGGGGSASSQREMKLMTERWVRETKPMGT